MGTAVVGLILFGIVVLILRRIADNVKSGKICSCGGDCKSCQGCQNNGCGKSCNPGLLKETQRRGMDK